MTLSLHPQNIDTDNWYYEENGGIEIIHRVKNNLDSYTCSHTIKIPWRKLRASLKRKDAKP